MHRRIPIIALILPIALAAGACLIASALPFHAVRGYLDSLAGDGSAEPYTVQLHTRLRIYFACLGIGGLAGAGWLFVDARRVQQGRSFLGRLSDDARQFAEDTLGLLRAHRGTLVALTLVGLLTRAPYLDQPIRYDEAHSFVNYANWPAYVTISTYNEPNNHVFHNLCVHVVTRMLGDAEWVIRLPALLAGVLAIPVTYLLATLWGGRQAGLLAALAVAASSPLIEYSVNARGYSMVCLITVCLGLLARYALSRGNRVACGAMSLLAALGFWIVPTMLYPYSMLLVWLIAWHRSHPRPTHQSTFRQTLLVHVMTTVGLTLLLYSPILITSGPSALVANRFIESPSWGEFLRQLPAALSETLRLLFRDMPPAAIVLVAIGAVVSLTPAQWKRSPQPGIVLLSCGVCAILVIVQHVLPPPRVWTFLLPLLLTASSCGLMAIVAEKPPRVRAAAMLLFAALLAGWPLADTVRHDSIRRSRETGTFPDAEQAVIWLQESLLPREPIVTIVPSSAPLVYYAIRHALPLEHFEWPGGPHTREDTAIIVVNTAWDQTVEDVLDALQLRDSLGGHRFEPVKRFPSATLYRMAVRRP